MFAESILRVLAHCKTFFSFRRPHFTVVETWAKQRYAGNYIVLGNKSENMYVKGVEMGKISTSWNSHKFVFFLKKPKCGDDTEGLNPLPVWPVGEGDVMLDVGYSISNSSLACAQWSELCRCIIFYPSDKFRTESVKSRWFRRQVLHLFFHSLHTWPRRFLAHSSKNDAPRLLRCEGWLYIFSTIWFHIFVSLNFLRHLLGG